MAIGFGGGYYGTADSYRAEKCSPRRNGGVSVLIHSHGASFSSDVYDIDVVGDLQNVRPSSSGVQEISDGNFLTFGSINTQTLGGASYVSAGAFKEVSDGLDAYLGKFDPNGNLIWGTCYGGEGGEEFQWAVEDVQGNIYAAGYTSSRTGIARQGHKDSLSGDNDFFLVKFSPNGYPIWATYYGGNDVRLRGGSFMEETTPICLVDSIGNVYLVGTTRSTTEIASPEGFSHQISTNPTFAYEDKRMNGFFVKFDSSGRRLVGSYLPNSRNLHLYGAALDRQGHLYLAGETLGLDTFPNGHEPLYGGQGDGFLAKIAISPTIGVEVLPSSRQAGSFLVFPNPATQLVTLVLPQGLSGQVQLHCYNSLGQLLRQTQLEASSSSLEYSLQDLAPGLYYLQLRQGEKTWTASLRVQ